MKAISFDDIEDLQSKIAELEKERDAANKRAKEYVGVFKRVNAAKRVWRKRAEQAEADAHLLAFGVQTATETI